MAEQKQQASEFRIRYFAFPGRGFPVRLTAALVGRPFEDEFMSFEQQAKEKADGQRRWSGPPELTVLDKDGKAVQMIGQSIAAMRYVAKLNKAAGLYPEDPLQAALVDEALDSSEDVTTVVFPKTFGVSDEQKKKGGEELCKEGSGMRYWLDKFVDRLDENAKRGNKNGFLVGDALTLADLRTAWVMNAVMMVCPGADREKGVLSEEKYKPLLKLIDTTMANETIKAYIKQYDANCAAYKEKPEQTIYKYSGKF
eukprot:CAMPEP_0202686060 /NCGR_PEP_ID=MMETSP1385-20130828/1850_1 /ASSEMBLY_ACC=CAM_ASM_000861 /TAXON_ID=933848 /ORGANISM="Elphidium margaritaceum" /LENGTH=253 /DNA_ID=CAMNT_0049340559 /DNA_START=58 /DNA_END=819 /DNA_ORIENTATION=+